MKIRSFFIFLFLTMVIVVLAVVSILTRLDDKNSGLSETLVLENFQEKIPTISQISVKHKDKTLIVKRSGKSWVLANRDNYVASIQSVSDLLGGLSRLRLRERKTSRENLYSRLNVEDIDAEDSNSRLLTITDKTNHVIVALIIGKEASEFGGASETGVYLRRPGDKPSWLAKGRLQIPSSVQDWVKPEFLDINKKRVQTVRVVHPDGRVMNVKRVNRSSSKFYVENLPTGQEIEYQSDIDNMSEGIDKLELEDVRELGKVEFSGAKTIKTVFQMYDGLLIKVQAFEDSENKFWGVFKASASLNASENIRQEVDKINSRVSNWVYGLPAHKYRYMTRSVRDVVKASKKK